MSSVRPLGLRLAYSVTRLPSPAGQTAPNFPRSRRCIHQLRTLPYNIDEGLGDFLSPAALRMIAVDYQQGLLTRLNDQVKGTDMENQSVTQTVISAASHRRHALIFNYASQALNNSFFLECLKPPPPLSTNEDSLGGLKADIRSQFGSLAQLQSTFSSAALGMINSGWVWLVSDENGEMEIVGTFGAGTLLVRSRNHMLTDEKAPILGEPLKSRYRGPLTRPERDLAPNKSSNPPRTTPTPSYDRPSATSPASGLHKPMPGRFPSTQSREMHASPSAFQLDYTPNIYSKPKTVSNSAAVVVERDFDDVGDILTPLLCVSVQEHAWVGAGYGVWGKEEYLKRFWTVVDWERVGRAYDKASTYR